MSKTEQKKKKEGLIKDFSFFVLLGREEKRREDSGGSDEDGDGLFLFSITVYSLAGSGSEVFNNGGKSNPKRAVVFMSF